MFIKNINIDIIVNNAGITHKPKFMERCNRKRI